MKEFDVLVIGGGPALRECIRTCRMLSPQTRLGAIRADKVMVNHCAMPYALSKRTTLERVIAPDTLVTRWDAQLFTDEAIKIDPKEKTVKCANDSFRYRKLDRVRTVEGKLIFREDDLTVIGSQIYGDINLVGLVDLMGQAILRNFTLYDILEFIHTTQPELSPEPAVNLLPRCAEDLWKRIK